MTHAGLEGRNAVATPLSTTSFSILSIRTTAPYIHLKSKYVRNIAAPRARRISFAAAVNPSKELVRPDLCERARPKYQLFIVIPSFEESRGRNKST
jgi:hypothetical protein